MHDGVAWLGGQALFLFNIPFAARGKPALFIYFLNVHMYVSN
jgi:hypothetical protein